MEIKVAHSVPTTQAIVEELVAGYDLGEVRQCDLLSHNQNDLFLIAADRGRFVLRISPASDPLAARSAAGLAYELDLLGHLVASGLPCPLPAHRRDGELWFELQAPEGPRRGVLFSHISGDPVQASAQVPELSARYGRMVASFHTLGDGFSSEHVPPRLTLGRLMDGPLALAEPLLVARPGDLLFLRALAGAVHRRMDELAARHLDVGPCHADLTGGNVHASGSSLALLDFEWCGLGWRAYDLAVFRWGTLLGTMLAGWSEERSEAVWSAFLNGYRDERELREPDLAAIAPLVVVRHFWYLGLRAANRARWGLSEVDQPALDWILALFRQCAERLLPRASAD